MKKSDFITPPIEYRPAPLWVWNDQLSPQRIRAQLRQLRKAGMGGAFIHPRPGLISEYLGPDWWTGFASALSEAKKLGMKIEIYDENSYPGGFAGGHVPSHLPHVVATGVKMRKLMPHEELPEVDSIRQPAIYATFDRLGKRYVFEAVYGETTDWLGGFAYVDLLRPETTQKFLEVTHEQYFKRFKNEFGRTITTIFCDEPMIGNGGVYDGPIRLPFSFWFAAQFKSQKNYDLTPEIPKLFLDIPGYQKIRFDYYEVLLGLFIKNCAQPMQEWCHKHKVAITGHYMEHTWLYPYDAGTPDAMAMYEWMDFPGIDMLESRIGRRGVKTSLGLTTQLLLLTVREALSVANQIGQKRVLCEMYGAGGYDSTFEDYKRMGDWLYTHGINYQNQHLSHMTIRGARKRDHPQTFSEHSSWWPRYKVLCDYFARLSVILSQGKMKQRILLLHPTTSGWVEANPINHSKKATPLYESYTNLVEHLCDRFWDFDFGDEFILENRAKVSRNLLHVGEQQYSIVIVPSAMSNLRSATVSLLEKFTNNAGRVLQLGAAPEFIDGIPSSRPERMAEKWTRIKGNDELDLVLAQTIGRQISIKGKATTSPGRSRQVPRGLSAMRRELDPKTICYFFTNMSDQRVKCEVNVLDRGLIEQWNALTGEIKSVGAGASFSLDLAHCGSALFTIRTDKKEAKQSPSRRRTEVNEECVCLELLSIHPSEPNVLMLDYCDVTTGKDTIRKVHHTHANVAIAQAHGFPRPVWDGAIQFKRTILDRDQFGQDTGFTAEFFFDVADIPASLELALECPNLYKIRVNDHPISFKTARSWLDRHIQSVNITHLVKENLNQVTIEARPYSIQMELEPVYLRGHFCLEPTSQGFRISTFKPLTIGSWRKQGHPFYGERVHYKFRHILNALRSRQILRLPDWAGSVVAITVNHVDAGVIGWPEGLTEKGGYEFEITKYLRQGENTIDLAVYGTPKNLIGPFHCYIDNSLGPRLRHDAPPRGTAFPAMWSHSPKEGPPPGKQYDVIDYGLFSIPEVVTLL